MLLGEHKIWGTGMRSLIKSLKIGSSSRTLSGHPSSVDGDALSADVVGSLACKENDRARKVVGRTPSVAGDSLENLSRSGVVIDEGRVHLGRDVSRSDWRKKEGKERTSVMEIRPEEKSLRGARRTSVDIDASGSEVVGHSSSDSKDTVLGGSVGRNRHAT